jgi:hypothetical protein
MRQKTWLVVHGLLLWSTFQSVALAHGLLARVRNDGTALSGTAYYSSGEPAAGEWVEIFDHQSPGATVAAFSTDTSGSFRFDGTPGHRYRIVVHGDEGHFIELSIAVEPGARARLIEDSPMTAKFSWLATPAWAVIGGVLLLVTLVASVYRLRGAKAA